MRLGPANPSSAPHSASHPREKPQPGHSWPHSPGPGRNLSCHTKSWPFPSLSVPFGACVSTGWRGPAFPPEPFLGAPLLSGIPELQEVLRAPGAGAGQVLDEFQEKLLPPEGAGALSRLPGNGHNPRSVLGGFLGSLCRIRGWGDDPWGSLPSQVILSLSLSSTSQHCPLIPA